MNWLEFRLLKKRDDRPHHIADLLLRQFNILKPPIDLELVVANLGINLVKISSPGWDAACNSVTYPACIWVNTECNLYRQRFGIAHELGHVLLHEFKVWRDAHFDPKGIDSECDANEFACGLLAPLWMLEPIVMNSRLTTDQLANLFQINVGPIGIQLEKLL